MAYLDKIKVNNTNVDVHDSRVASIDTTPTENSTNLITSGGVYSVLGDIQSALDAILGSGVTLITFTISGDTYQAEEGMTWQQWADSSYNVVANPYTGQNSINNGNWYVSGNEICITDGFMSGGSVADASYVLVTPQEVIMANYSYKLERGSDDPA